MANNIPAPVSGARLLYSLARLVLDAFEIASQLQFGVNALLLREGVEHHGNRLDGCYLLGLVH